MKTVWMLLTGVFLGVCPCAWASSSLKVSERFIEHIAMEESIPPKLLKSIAWVESGFYPWVLNIRGRPYFFSARKEAEAFLEKALKEGVTNIDIGCAQINWHFHGLHFKRPHVLLSPEISLRYVARLLRQNKTARGSWMQAALFYHSSHHKHQRIYHLKLLRYLTQKQRDS